MTTTKEAIRAYVQSVGRKVTVGEIKAAVSKEHPNQWMPRRICTAAL